MSSKILPNENEGVRAMAVRVCTGCDYKKINLGFKICVQPKIVDRLIFTPNDETPEWCPYNDVEVLKVSLRQCFFVLPVEASDGK
jgi:hypothetical protein